MPNPTVALSMIVRNEAHVIRRCLDSVRGLIDHWIVVDTGSADGTQQVIRDYMATAGIPGAVHERPWEDFATNRTQALRLARHNADYSLLIDADDVLVTGPGFTWPPLIADAYRFDFRDGNIRYQRPCLIANRLPWRYDGVLHEFLTGGNGDGPTMLGVAIKRSHDGARSRNPTKFRDDAAVLEQALLTERNPMMVQRYWFYLGQSWRDAGEKEKAIGAYLHRATLGGWAEEVCVSLYTAARLKRDLGHPEQEILDLYARAFMAAPMRAEGLHGAAQVERDRKRYAEAYNLARLGASLPLPHNRLFVEPWVHQVGLPDEMAINGFWAGEYRESLIACVDLLESGNCPRHEVKRVCENADHALRRIRERATAAAGL